MHVCLQTFTEFLPILVGALCYVTAVAESTLGYEINGNYWKKQGQETLQNSLNMIRTTTVAKNVIFFLGDGMGIPSVTAIRIYKGQKKKKSGEEEQLAFEKFPYVSLSKTYALDRQNPDSANTATAYFCGVKANYETIGVDGRVKKGDCQASLDTSTHVTSVLQWAQDEGKSTGFATSTRVTHATPAGLYAHTAFRDWESSTSDERCDDIAKQLVRNRPGKDINVILGGGRREFIPSNLKDIEGIPGKRNDSLNLLEEWFTSKESKGLRARAVFDYESFSRVNPQDVDYLLGLFNTSHLPYVADRPEISAQVPNLVDLTKTAIKILRKNPKGYFLAVEGGKIDTAHHMNWARKALEEGVEFDDAIQAAVDLTSRDDTLIVVTADHSHTFTIGGLYPARGSDILGLGGLSDVDNMTITTLSYANGPGYVNDSRTVNLTQEEVVAINYQYQSTFPLEYETHGAEDVAVFATGPMAHLFHGVHEQSYIPYVVGYASCTGPNKAHCKNAARRNSFEAFSALYLVISMFPVYFTLRKNFVGLS